MTVFIPADGRPDREWIEKRLGAWTTMHSVVPHGFEAYVRVFHPVSAQHLDWTGSEYVMLEERRLTWREVADLTGTVAHPLMQWDRIGGSLPVYPGETRGWQYGAPDQGRMHVEELSRVVGILARRSQDGAARAGLWEGVGWLHPGGSSVVTLRSADRDDAPGAEPERSVDDTLPFDPREWQSRKLELPNRAYFVFGTDLALLADPAWARDSGWGWGTAVWEDTPNLLWPLDRSWFLVSEIDFDSTVIGCSAEAAAALLEDPALEAGLVPEGASLTADADRINV